VATDLQTLDPAAAGPGITRPRYDALTAVGPDGNIVPRLAGSITSDDLLTWTVEMADGATFADGSPVDATAVVYSLERGKSLTESPLAPVFAQIDSVTADDDSTVTIVLTQANVAFPRDMAGLAGMVVNPPPTATRLGARGWPFESRSGSGEAPVPMSPRRLLGHRRRVEDVTPPRRRSVGTASALQAASSTSPPNSGRTTSPAGFLPAAAPTRAGLHPGDRHRGTRCRRWPTWCARRCRRHRP
jgi:hypothetical protein